MPLYYLNMQQKEKEFFTDAGSISEALLIARPIEFVRLKSYYGRNDLKNRYKTINKGIASPELKLLMDWLPKQFSDTFPETLVPYMRWRWRPAAYGAGCRYK